MGRFSAENLSHAVLYVLALIMSVAVHEFGHAYVADRLGDRVARSQGRVTLNPLAHIDPIGTLFFPLIGALFQMPVLGWGRPVETSLSARWVPRWMTMRTAHLFVSIAGPAMNIVLALILGVPYVLLLKAGRAGEAQLVAYLVVMNVGLCFFNLIPIPPLDGRSILFWFFDDRHPVAQFLTQYGQFIFLAMLVAGAFRVVLIPANYFALGWLQLLSRLAL